MNKDYKSVNLSQLKNDIKFLEDEKLGYYFDNDLSMSSYRTEDGYSTILEFFNHLKDVYNEDVKNNVNMEEYHETLLKTFSWFLPFLLPCHKIIVQANICILADEEEDNEFHKKPHFKDKLEQANKFIKTMGDKVFDERNPEEKEAICKALDSIGYLNLREHNYECAILCLHLCIKLLSMLDIDSSTNTELFELYIQNIVRIANCYEYTDKPWEAVKYMLGIGSLENTESVDFQHAWRNLINDNAAEIRSKIIGYYSLPNDKINIKNKTTVKIVKDICALFFMNSKENLHYSVFTLDKGKEQLPKPLKSFIHVLAHCISEYAAKVRTDEYAHPFCSTLQMFSRFLLDWLVISCHEDALVTCQATVRAENDACPEALKLLLKRHAALDKKREDCTEEEKNELQEIEFFLFYFSEQELRYNYKDFKLENIFKEYGDKFFGSASKKAQDNDFDQLFHYYVIKFKYLFKQLVDDFIHANKRDQFNTQELYNVFLEMCRCKGLCTDHIFKGLIDECERLEALFILFHQFQWLNNKEINVSRQNEIKQLCSIYKGYDDIDNINNAIPKLYKEIIKRNKILILAPVKNAPACSSEYKKIHNLLDLPAYSYETTIGDGTQFISEFQKIKRQRKPMTQYCLNTNQSYKSLKWAVFYPNEGEFIYLYMKHEISIAYNEVIPIYLDTEHDAIKEILKRIDDGISDEFYHSVCAKDKCSNMGESDECNDNSTLRLKPNYKSSLKDLISELLVFLEFDFLVGRQIGYPEKNDLLIYYPKESHNFTILAFDSQQTLENVGKGLCEICRECFVKESQNKLSEKEACEPMTEHESHWCKMFPRNVLEDKRKKFHGCIDNDPDLTYKQKEAIKTGTEMPDESKQMHDFKFLCMSLDSCIENCCDAKDDQDCIVCKMLSDLGI